MALVRQLYPTMTGEQVGLMIGRSGKAVRGLAKQLKIRKEVHAPKNWRPIGSERMDRGHLIRKVTDTGQPKKDWKRVDVIEWEAINGPVPNGMLLCLDRPGLPRTPENLVLVPASLQLQRSRWNKLSPVGAERFKDGVWLRKISETGNRAADWKRVDAILWEQTHGPIPPGLILMAIDNSNRTQDLS